MNSTTVRPLAVESRRLNKAIGIGIFLALVLGFFFADSEKMLVAYLYVTVPAIVPLIIWARKDSSGIPVLPIACGFYFIYFALPVLRNNIGHMDDSEIERACTTVGYFLMAATITWWLVSYKRYERSLSRSMSWAISDSLVVKILFVGLIGGILFQLAFTSGVLASLGSALGIVRSFFITAAAVSCFLMGYARARRLLTETKWAFAIICLMLLLMLQLVGLFLVGAMIYYIATVFGYIITARRIPWRQLGFALAVLSFLHVGKGVMRDKYWAANSQGSEISVIDMPGVFVNWLIASTDVIVNGESKGEQSFIDRASLLLLLTKVQGMTPGYIPYLGGESYWLLPSMLVPRFISPDKINSQAVLAMLNVRYGFQTESGTQNTTIGWGLIAEAFANFGNNGVIVVGLIYGAICGFFTRISANASAASLPSLLAVAALVILINLESDLAYMLTNLWQAMVSVFLFFLPMRMMLRRQAQKDAIRAMKAR